MDVFCAGDQTQHEIWRSAGGSLASVRVLQSPGQVGCRVLSVCLIMVQRFPGGNADCHTLMYQFTSNGEVSAFQYSNWDGSHSRGSFVPAALAKSDCISKLSSLLSKWKGPLDSSSTMIDNSADSDEYDSEWSSKEIMVVVPAKWSRATHSIFNEQSRREIWIFLLVNHRLGKPLTRDCMQVKSCAKDVSVLFKEKKKHLFEFVCPPLWAPVFRLHQYSVNPRERYYQPRAPKKQIPPVSGSFLN